MKIAKFFLVSRLACLLTLLAFLGIWMGCVKKPVAVKDAGLTQSQQIRQDLAAALQELGLPGLQELLAQYLEFVRGHDADSIRQFHAQNLPNWSDLSGLIDSVMKLFESIETSGIANIRSQRKPDGSIDIAFNLRVIVRRAGTDRKEKRDLELSFLIGKTGETKLGYEIGATNLWALLAKLGKEDRRAVKRLSPFSDAIDSAGLSEDEAAFLREVISLFSSGNLTGLLNLVDQDNYGVVGGSEDYPVLAQNVQKLASGTYTVNLTNISRVSKQESTDQEGDRVTQFRFFIDAFLATITGRQFQLRFPVTLLAKKINNLWTIIGILNQNANLLYYGGQFLDPQNPNLLTFNTTIGMQLLDVATGEPPPAAAAAGPACTPALGASLACVGGADLACCGGGACRAGVPDECCIGAGGVSPACAGGLDPVCCSRACATALPNDLCL